MNFLAAGVLRCLLQGMSVSSRFSWIEAIASPVATPSPTRAASDSWRLASIVSGTASVAPRL
jgi:hypothetical protein